MNTPTNPLPNSTPPVVQPSGPARPSSDVPDSIPKPPSPTFPPTPPATN